MRAIGGRRPNVFGAFLSLADAVMHTDSSLSQLDRELIGAHVSKRFGCSFCHLGHIDTAEAIGGDDVQAMFDQPDARLTTLFAFADKVVDNAVTDAEIASLAGEGISEAEIEDVIFVASLFGFANRMVTGFGLDYQAERDRAGSRALANGYARR